MVTVSKTVEKLVKENAFIEEALIRGIVNYVALAEELHPHVSRLMNEQVAPAAIVMALRRVRETLKKSEPYRPTFDPHADIIVTSDLFEITFKKSPRVLASLKDVYEQIDSERDFITATQGRNEITVIANKRNQGKVLQCFSKEKILSECTGLASLGITLPAHAIDETGYFYLITRAFTWEGIPLVELVSSFTELHIIVHEKHVPKAFIILKDVISKNSK